MNQIGINFSTQTLYSDLSSVIAVFLKLRALGKTTLLLESGEYRANENVTSYLCFDPLAEIVITETQIIEKLPDGQKITRQRDSSHKLVQLISEFSARFSYSESIAEVPGLGAALFGYTGFSALELTEEIKLSKNQPPFDEIPVARYAIFKHALVFNQTLATLTIVSAKCGNLPVDNYEIGKLIFEGSTPKILNFKSHGDEESSFSDKEHLEIIEICKKHIARGDVFQIVPSRRFSQKFSGDEFNVYRVLRVLNRSPYLYYFDFCDYKIFGSSPEAQLLLNDRKATISPLAGTYPRTGKDEADSEAIKKLLDDPKENSEHVMLVDLARNDLSIFCFPVMVESYREVQLYSHVIHLVSKVCGELMSNVSPLEILATTFPAGTLSGAPKYRAIELINQYEPHARHFYGGMLGAISLPNSKTGALLGEKIVHAIMIRSFLSHSNVLYSQAGSGVVFDSKPEKEVKEVKDKLAALRAAIIRAESI